MRVVLNHTIVPAADRHAAATFFADLLGLTVGGQVGPFAPVRVNDDLTLDFDDRATVVPGHYGSWSTTTPSTRCCGGSRGSPRSISGPASSTAGIGRSTSSRAGGGGILWAPPGPPKKY
ncbi:hypothetical protein [Nocardia brasiliensis]|uniref:hypothetical protein n=1 Tax=Nocardia brasiliensis TaxID=37326 RepID=UPI0024568228|nr:hypothetical protein [Nocardia brasiliensis]